MAECFGCGQKVKHQWEHVECAAHGIIFGDRNKWLMGELERMYPEVFVKLERIYQYKIKGSVDDG